MLMPRASFIATSSHRTCCSTTTGRVHILDLGIARVEEEGDSPVELTKTGSILGTVDYMPPEQALNTRKADQRADIYSLGCTLYFLLVGRPVYAGETVMERLVAHREEPAPSLRKDCPAAPEWLDQVFQRMIAKRPEGRFQSMSEVISALEREGAESGRPRRVAKLIGALVLAVLIGAAAVWIGSMLNNSAANRSWRMVGDVPVIAGRWKEWDGIYLNITQTGEHFSADCQYGQPGVTVHWQADGTISRDGKIVAELVHTDPPRPKSSKAQTCTAQLEPDGRTIRGRAAWAHGGEDFTWRLQESKAAQ